MISTDLSYTVDACFSLPGLDVEVQTYHHPEPFKGVFEARTYTLSLSLTPWISYSRCCYLDADGQPGPWINAGDIIFSPLGTKMMVSGSGGRESYRRLRCSFSPALFENTTGFDGKLSGKQLAASLNVQAPTIKRDLYRMVSEVSESRLGREKVLDATGQMVMVDMARYLCQVSMSAQPLRTSLAGWQMRRITDYVEGMIDHCPSVDQLARLCEIGPGHLARLFKVSTGRTVGDYVREVRMIKARSLLTDTRLSIKEIAHRLGFSTPSSFCVAFGKATGMTPKQFRIRFHVVGRDDPRA